MYRLKKRKDEYMILTKDQITKAFDITGASYRDFLLIIADNTESTDNKRFIHIEEGSGDNLTHEDETDGYVDYINYTNYSYNGGGELDEEDGGMCLLTDYYIDTSLTSIINHILEENDITENVEYLLVA
jgi:hypothetical protein